MDKNWSNLDKALEAELDMAVAKAEADGAALNEALSQVIRDSRAGRSFERHRVVTRYTNEERLAYYRAHGLFRCDDYPGGDAAFEADVLSGQYHDEEGVMDEPPREDAYAIAKIEDGTFAFDMWFSHYGDNLAVLRAYNSHLRQTRTGMVYR